MALNEAIYRLRVSSTIMAFELAFTRIHKLERSGMVWTPVEGMPAEGLAEFNHNVNTGLLTFGVPGPGGFLYEIIHVLYEA